MLTRSGWGVVSRGVGGHRIGVATAWQRCPSQQLGAMAQRGPQHMQMLPVGPGPMGAGLVHKMHIQIELHGLTHKQQQHVLGSIADPAHPVKLFSFVKAVNCINRGQDNAAVQIMLHEWEPGMPRAMQEAHLTAQGLGEQLVREGLKVQLPGGQEHWLKVRYRELTCAPGQVVVKVKGMPPEHAQEGVVRTLLQCAGYTPEQTPIAREFMAPFKLSAPGLEIGDSGVVLAYVQYPAGDPDLQQLPRSFMLGPGREVFVEVDTRGVNRVVPPPPPRAQEQPQGLPQSAAGTGAGAGSRGQPTGPAGGLPAPPGLDASVGLDPGNVTGGGSTAGPQGGHTPPEVAGLAITAAAATPARPALPRGQQGAGPSGMRHTSGAGTSTAPRASGPEVPMGPTRGLGAGNRPGVAGMGPAAVGWQGPTRSHPWQQAPAQQQHQHQQPQQQPPADAEEPVTVPAYPAVAAAVNAMGAEGRAQATMAYTAWQQTSAGSSWDATMRDWLDEEGVKGEALEGAMLLFHHQNRQLLTGLQGPNCVADLDGWAVTWAQGLRLVKPAYASSSDSGRSNGGAPSEGGSEGGGGGGGQRGGRRSSSRVSRPAPLPCQLPPPFHSPQPHPRRGGGRGHQ